LEGGRAGQAISAHVRKKERREEKRREEKKSRVGQNRIYTPNMIVYLVIFLPKIPCIHQTHTCNIYMYGFGHIYGFGQPYPCVHET